MDTFNSKGSFGIPEHMKRQLEQPVKQKTEREYMAVSDPAQAAQPSVAVPGAAPEVPATPAEEKTRDEQDLNSLRTMWEKRLETRVSEKDLRDYVFKGKLIKDGVEVIPKMMRVTFQSVTPAELSEIDQKMAVFREENKWTTDGLSNENAVRVLSYGWIKTVEVGEDEIPKAPRSMGNTPEERYKVISAIPALAVQEVIEAWEGYNTLLKIALREKRLLKK